MSYIEIKNYTKIIKKQTVLNDIMVNFEKGNIYGIIGSNGSGKTMLLRAICGLIHPTQGYIYVDGVGIGTEVDFPKSCGVIIENQGFWDDLTGFECLKILAGIKKQIKEDEIKDWMFHFGLNPEDSKKFRKYSLGMKQKLALIQAFMEKPDLILLDEPTNALDEETILILRKVILEQKERGATIIMTSHIREEIELLSDQIYKMELGKIKLFR